MRRRSMRIDDIAQTSLLYDFYGQLLSRRQREVMELYHEENLTLAEIAKEFGISRQGVHDALKNAEKALNEYEEKLGLVAKLQRSSDAVRRIDEIIDGVIAAIHIKDDGAGNAERSISDDAAADGADTDWLIGNLKKVKDIIDNLEE